jgi:hypothetical protein
MVVEANVVEARVFVVVPAVVVASGRGVVRGTHEHDLHPFTSWVHTASVPGLQLQRRMVGQFGFSVAVAVVGMRVVVTRDVVVEYSLAVVVPAGTQKHAGHPLSSWRQSTTDPGLQLQARGVRHSAPDPSEVVVGCVVGGRVAAAVVEGVGSVGVVERATHEHSEQPSSSRYQTACRSSEQAQSWAVGQPRDDVVVVTWRVVVAVVVGAADVVRTVGLGLQMHTGHPRASSVHSAISRTSQSHSLGISQRMGSAVVSDSVVKSLCSTVVLLDAAVVSSGSVVVCSAGSVVVRTSITRSVVVEGSTDAVVVVAGGSVSVET